MAVPNLPGRGTPTDNRVRRAAISAMLALANSTGANSTGANSTSANNTGANNTGAKIAPPKNVTPVKSTSRANQMPKEAVPTALSGGTNAKNAGPDKSLRAKVGRGGSTVRGAVSRVLETDLDKRIRRRRELAALVGSTDPLATAHRVRDKETAQGEPNDDARAAAPRGVQHENTEGKIERPASIQKVELALAQKRAQMMAWLSSLGEDLTRNQRKKAGPEAPRTQPQMCRESGAVTSHVSEKTLPDTPQPAAASASDPRRAQLIAQLVERQRNPVFKNFDPDVAAARTERLLSVAERIQASDFERVAALMVAKNTDTLHIDLGWGKKELAAMTVCLPFQFLERRDFTKPGQIDLQTIIGILNDLPGIREFGEAVSNANYWANIHPVPVGIKETGSTADEYLWSPYRLALTVSQVAFPDAVEALKKGEQTLAWDAMRGPSITLRKLETLRPKTTAAHPAEHVTRPTAWARSQTYDPS